MEPMALGSPVHSESPNSPYLPEFLTGEADPVNSPLSRPAIVSPPSPGRPTRHVTFGTPQSFTKPFSPADDRLNRGAPRGTPTTGLLAQSEKGSGPPTVGLFDTLNPVTVPSTHFQQPKSFDPSLFEANLNASLLASSPVPARQQQWVQNEPLSSNLNWVTVFGYPPYAASTILTQFTSFGTLVAKQWPRQGNWMHLCYQTKAEVRRALRANGIIFGRQIMIGVMPCTDLSIIKEAGKENSNVVECGPSLTPRPSSSAGIPATPTSPGLSSTFASPYSFTDTPTRGARPLRPTCTEVLSPQNTPQRSSSFMSKAMDYVFNW